MSHASFPCFTDLIGDSFKMIQSVAALQQAKT